MTWHLATFKHEVHEMHHVLPERFRQAFYRFNTSTVDCFMRLLNISIPWHIHVLGEIDISSRGEWSKKSTRLREAASAKPGPARPHEF
jgi:hypothetical protein